MNWGWIGFGLVWRHWGQKGCTEFVYPECWRFDNVVSSKIDDVLAEDVGLLHVLPLTVHPPSCLKVRGGWLVVGGGW